MDIQTLAALLIVAAAALYLVRRWVRAWFSKGSPSCHGCVECPAASTRHRNKP